MGSTSARSTGSTGSVLRPSAIGAAAARQMRSRGQSYDSTDSAAYDTFTMHDFDHLESDDDFDIFLDAAHSQNELSKFDSMYGFGFGESQREIEKDSPEPVAELTPKPKKSSSKAKITRQSSFTDELDDLLNDIM